MPDVLNDDEFQWQPSTNYPAYSTRKSAVTAAAATWQTLQTIAISASSIVDVNATVMAIDGTDRYAVDLRLTVYRAATGNAVALRGPLASNLAVSNASGYDAKLEVSGTDVLLRVKAPATNKRFDTVTNVQVNKGASFDPTTLALSGHWRGSYTAPGSNPRWTGVASAGGSSGRNLIASVVTPPGAGTAVNGRTPAVFVPATPHGLDTNDAASNFFSATAYSGWVLLYLDAIATNSATAYQNDVIFNTTSGGYVGLTVRSSGKVYLYHYDGSFKQAEAAITTGGWRLVHFKFTGSQIKVGVNGTWGSAVTATTLGNNLTGEKIRFGQYAAGGTYPLNGRILDVGLANTALADSILASDVKTYCNNYYAGVGV
jgi:hypothetical protein